MPGFAAKTLYGLFAPSKTPANIVTLLNQEVVRVLHRPEVKERLFSAGIEVAASSPEEFAAILKGDMAKWAKVIQDAGIRDE